MTVSCLSGALEFKNAFLERTAVKNAFYTAGADGNLQIKGSFVELLRVIGLESYLIGTF